MLWPVINGDGNHQAPPLLPSTLRRRRDEVRRRRLEVQGLREDELDAEAAGADDQRGLRLG
jgi:hypothetical protein